MAAGIAPGLQTASGPTRFLAQISGGHLLIYGGLRPPKGTAAGAAPLLADLQLPSPAGTMVGEQMRLTPVTATGLIQGVPTWARWMDSAGGFVADCDVNTTPVADITLTFGSHGRIDLGSTVSIVSLTLGLPLGVPLNVSFAISEANAVASMRASIPSVTLIALPPDITLTPAAPTFDLSKKFIGTLYPPYSVDTAVPYSPLQTGVTLDVNTGLVSADFANPALQGADTAALQVRFGVEDTPPFVPSDTYPQILLSDFNQLMTENQVMRRYYNHAIWLPWKNTGGDYIDNVGAQNPAGFTTAFVSQTTSGTGWALNQTKQVLNLTTFVANWISGAWKDPQVYLRFSTSGLSVYSKTYTDPNLRLALEITFSDGTPAMRLSPVMDAYWESDPNPFTVKSSDTVPLSQVTQFTMGAGYSYAGRWDVSVLPSTAVQSAMLAVTKSTSFTAGTLTIHAYRVDIPYKPVAEPLDYTGCLSAGYLNDVGIENDPMVIANYKPRYPTHDPVTRQPLTQVALASGFALDGLDSYSGGLLQLNANCYKWPFEDRTWAGAYTSGSGGGGTYYSATGITNLRQCRIRDLTDQVNVKPPPGGDMDSWVREESYGTQITSSPGGYRQSGGGNDHIFLGNDMPKVTPGALVYRQTRLSGNEVVASRHRVDALGNPDRAGATEVSIPGVGSPKHIFARWQEFYLMESIDYQDEGYKGWGAGVLTGASAPYGTVNRPYMEGASGDRPFGRPINDGTGRGGWQGKCERYLPNQNRLGARPGQPGNDLYNRVFYFYHMDMSINSYHSDWDIIAHIWRKNGGCWTPRNTWLDIECEWKINTCFEVIPGYTAADAVYDANHDGIVRAWLNGRLVHETLDHRYMRDPTVGIDDFWLSGYYGGQAPFQITGAWSVLYRNLVIAKQRIGPVKVP